MKAINVLTRISHQLSAAADDAPCPAVFSRVGMLDGLSSTTPRPSGRKPHWTRHFATLATKPGEKRGLILVAALFFAFSIHAELDRSQLKQIERYSKTLNKSRDVDERVDAARLLGRFKEAPEVIEPLIAALADVDSAVRRQAANSLWRIGQAAAPAEKALRKALGDPSLGVRVRAASALESLGVPETELIDVRVKCLRANRLRDRILAARDLVGLVPGEQLIGPITEVAAAEADTRAYDLGERYLDPVKVLERLVKTGKTDFVSPILDDVMAGNPGARWLLKGLVKLDPKPETWNAVLMTQLKSQRIEDREVALELLGERTNEDSGVEEWITSAITVLDDQRVCQRAIWTLKLAGGYAAPAAAKLAELVSNNPDANIRKAAADALGVIGNRDQAFPSDSLRQVALTALPALCKAAIEDPNEDVRGAALGSLHDLRVSADEVLPTFVAAAKGDSLDHNRFKTLQYIRDLGTDATAAIPDLEKIISDDPASRAMAEQALNSVKNNKPDFSLDVTTGPIEAGSAKALQQLRAMGITFDQHTFYRAVADVEVAKARLFLGAGMSANDPVTDFGMRPLHTLFFGPPGCAMAERPTPAGTKEMTRLLLEHGADANATDERNNSVLKIAVMACDAEVMQMLLDAGADMYAKDMHGMVPFELTLWSGTDAADPLIKAGFRLSAEKAATYRDAYKDNPKALELIKRATAE